MHSRRGGDDGYGFKAVFADSGQSTRMELWQSDWVKEVAELWSTGRERWVCLLEAVEQQCGRRFGTRERSCTDHQGLDKLGIVCSCYCIVFTVQGCSGESRVSIKSYGFIFL